MRVWLSKYQVGRIRIPLTWSIRIWTFSSTYIVYIYDIESESGGGNKSCEESDKALFSTYSYTSTWDQRNYDDSKERGVRRARVAFSSNIYYLEGVSYEFLGRFQLLDAKLPTHLRSFWSRVPACSSLPGGLLSWRQALHYWTRLPLDWSSLKDPPAPPRLKVTREHK